MALPPAVLLHTRTVTVRTTPRRPAANVVHPQPTNPAHDNLTDLTQVAWLLFG